MRLPAAGDGGDAAMAEAFNAIAERQETMARQFRDLALVTSAVARGDVSKRLTVEIDGVDFGLKDVINGMIDQLGRFATEVTRVAREVGVEGVLGGEIQVPTGAGIWKAIVDDMNSLSRNVAIQVRAVARVVEAVQEGRFDARVTALARGEIADLFASINRTVESLERSKLEAARAQARLSDKAEELTAASRYKSQFLANMSHELRTPLNGLLILAQKLADNGLGHLDAREVEYAKTIYAAGTDLLDLINEILDLAKVESGTMHVEPEPIDLSALFAELTASFAPIAAQRSIAFEAHLGPGTSAPWTSDGRRVKQILRNLLSNALKFTTAGSVVLSARVVDEEPPRLELIVADTGIGIAPEKHALVFEAFQQADGTTTRNYGGTGLGLTISRDLARLLGGDVSIASELGKGSTFTVCLPELASPARAVPAPPSIARPPSPDALRGRVILVADDDVRNSFALAAVLEASGATIVYADNGARAVEMVSLRPEIAAVLMDVMMPSMDGLEATRRIRSDPSKASLPIIAVTANAMPGDRERCLSAGASDYVTKPVRPEVLLDLLARSVGP